MRTKLLWLLVVAAQVSCGGELPVDDPEIAAPDLLATPAWPDAPDLGVVVSSEIVPTGDTPPPPDFVR